MASKDEAAGDYGRLGNGDLQCYGARVARRVMPTPTDLPQEGGAGGQFDEDVFKETEVEFTACRNIHSLSCCSALAAASLTSSDVQRGLNRSEPENRFCLGAGAGWLTRKMRNLGVHHSPAPLAKLYIRYLIPHAEPREGAPKASDAADGKEPLKKDGGQHNEPTRIRDHQALTAYHQKRQIRDRDRRLQWDRRTDASQGPDHELAGEVPGRWLQSNDATSYIMAAVADRAHDDAPSPEA